MIHTLLIANRGEIACRIVRTARVMGMRTVAAYSDADANALHVRQADAAVHIGPSAARESYLMGERIIAAARATGADAIHPGYGFLSENADFADAVIAAGLTWVGPNPASIRAMGLKDAAKALMIAAGVPVTPGYMGEDQSPERLAREADAIGYPVLIKAVAGGGGKGMRRVDTAQHFAAAYDSCRREAASSFGDDRVLIEKYIERPRHIEVQIFGDRQGNVVHLFERDCSLQRRHQKVIEEAPAPGMDAATRAALCDVAVKAARAVDYVGAGTIEFIADASEGLRADRIWFMEMNTRLQVEHPVTEAITGVDLVEWQLRVAAGAPLPRRQDELTINGWAMEARLYAENPATGFLPSTGRFDHLRLPADIRVDSGVAEGDVISAFYDPMIAKLIVHAPTRDAAVAKLVAATGAIKCAPVRTNGWFLRRLASLPAFATGNVSTGLIAEEGEALIAAPVPSAALLAHAASGLIDAAPALVGFRLNAPPRTSVRLAVDGEAMTLAYAAFDAAAKTTRPEQYRFEDGAAFYVSPWRASGRASGGASSGSLLSPMPGKVIAVDVAAGDMVTKGQRLVTLEAMKMEHALVAPYDGTIAELNAVQGRQVSEGTLLVRVEPVA
jgi:3-methylcrotonyl-CoA carboxylase alpha subunit